MWKKSEILNNKKFRILLLLEVLLLLVPVIGILRGNKTISTLSDAQVTTEEGVVREENGYSVDGSSNINGPWLEMSGFSMAPGTYCYYVTYESEDNGVNKINITSNGKIYRELLENELSLYSGRTESSCEVYVTSRLKADEVNIHADYYGTGKLTITDIRLVKTTASYRMLLVMFLLGFLLLDSMIMLYVYMGKYPLALEKKLVYFGIPALAILTSLPLFVDYIIVGADLGFHLLRIEFLGQSLAQGIFPTRVEPMWLYGHGYANSLFYCDTFLVIPALLRLIGFPMSVSYGGYIFLVNLATAIVAYISFRGIFRDRMTGMLGSMLYTLAPYRVYNIYNRSAVGEYTAMIFLPLLCYGFYLIFAEDTEDTEYRHYWLLPVLGFSGIIQSHVLSCEIAGAFTILLCLLCIRKVFRKKTFLELVKVVVGTVLANIWFLLPMLDMMLADQYRYSNNSGVYIQDRGILGAQIFFTMQNAGSNSKFQELGMVDTEPIYIGAAVLLGVIVYFAIRNREKEQDPAHDKAAKVAFVLGCVAIAVSTYYFPWNELKEANSVLELLTTMIQFPTRLTIIAAIAMTLVACTAGYWMLRWKDKVVKYIFFAAICGGCILFSMYQTNDLLLTRDQPLRLNSMASMGHSGILGAEYLPLDVEWDFYYHDAWPSDGVTVEAFEKENLNTLTTVTTSAEDGDHYIDLPMLLYKGYHAKDAATGEVFPVTVGENGHVRAILPAGYQGTVKVWYSGMWYWRVAEGITFLFWAFVIAGKVVQWKKLRKTK